jgi:hypothetical protein
VPYDIKLSCGECIASGYNFLWRSEVNSKKVNDNEYPKNTGKYEDTDVMCCEGSFEFYKGLTIDFNSGSALAECAKLFQRANNRDKKDWRESLAYKSTAYAMHMCPFRRSSCGPNSLINFYDMKEDGAIHIIGLK